jgi:hypothetical protein
MRVEGPGPHVNPAFGADPRKNWQLWEWDVVEAFLQMRRHPDDMTAPYLEVQLSPRNQGLVLVILEPRRRYYTPLHFQWHTEVELGEGVWSARARFRLPDDFPEGELWGGLFACLGTAPRGFYALAPNPGEFPDFHRPQHFVRF